MGMTFRKNDQVIVIAGDDKGKSGRLLMVIRDKNRVIVEKVNFMKRHTRARSAGQQGGVIEREAPMHVSNVMHLCSKCQTPASSRQSWISRTKAIGSARS